MFKGGTYVYMVAFVLASPVGGDVEKNGDFKRNKYVHSIFSSPPGGDVEKIGDFQRDTYVHMAAFLIAILIFKEN